MRRAAHPSARPSILSELDQLGRALEDLVRRGGDSHQVESLAKGMQPALISITRARLDDEALPLPELLVAGLATEWVLLDASSRPSARHFSERFEEMLGPVIEYCRLRGMYIDRWVLEQEGMSSRRQQARIASLVETTVKAPIEDRRILFPYLVRERTPAQIAAETGRPEPEVRRVISRSLREAIRQTSEWMHKWTRAADPPRAPRKKRKR